MDPQKPRSRFLKWVLVLAILIVLNLFFSYGIQLFFPQLSFQDYCPVKQVTIQPQTQNDCVSQGGAWTENNYPQKYPAPPIPISVGINQPTGYCDLNFTCQKKYNDAFDLYQRNVFIARVILGVLAVAIGFFVAQFEAVSLGLSLGGVLSLFIATVGYWSKLGQYFQVIVLGVALAALIWLGVRKQK